MTSDCEDVRMLIQALAAKIELSWKVGGVNHVISQFICHSIWVLIFLYVSASFFLCHPLTLGLSLSCTHFLTRTHYTYSRIISSLLLTLSKHPSPTNISHSAFSPYPLLFQLLSAQHLSNCAFGLQGLSSTEPEVRALVHALVPKILACRDELSMEQIGHALFGLQNLSSDHEEVNRQQHKICLCIFSRVWFFIILLLMQATDKSRALIRLCLCDP